MAHVSPVRHALVNLPVNTHGTPIMKSPSKQHAGQKRLASELEDPASPPVPSRARTMSTSAGQGKSSCKEIGISDPDVGGIIMSGSFRKVDRCYRDNCIH